MRILDILNAPWAICPESLLEIRRIYLAHLRDEPMDIAAIEARLGRPLENKREPYQVYDGVAVVEANGILAKKMNLFSQVSGGTSMQLLEQDILQAVDDPAVHSIVMAVDSPGGTIDGMFELANAIYEARGQKRMVAFADGLMGSAAYIAGSAMDEVYAGGQAAQLGSIGVIMMHTDKSKADEMRGEKVTEMTAGKYKRIASEHAPLSDEGRADIQDKLDYVYSMAVDQVARNRGVNFKTVLDRMADGRIFIGDQAVKAGLADGITTLPALISKLNQEHQSSVNSHMEATMEGKDEKKPAAAAVAEKVKPELTAELEKAVFDRGKAEGFAEGVKAECARIQAIEDVAMPGHEALIAALKYDGKTTGPEAAVQILAAEKKKGANKLAALKADAPAPVAHAEAPVDQTKAEAESKIDPNELAAEARKYQQAQAKEGNNVTIAQAVRYVQKQLNPAA